MNSKESQDKISLEKLLFDEKFSEEDISKRQWQILDAATKMFSEKGFGETRTSEIAKEAEVAEGTIFRYYKTKKDLLIGLVIPLVTKFLRPLILKSAETILENEKGNPIEVVLEKLLIDRLELVNHNLPLIKTVFVEAAYHPELLDKVQKNIAPAVIPFINKFVDANVQNENFRDIDPMVITRTLMSLLAGYILLTNIFPEFFKIGDDEEEIKKIVDIFLNGVKN